MQANLAASSSSSLAPRRQCCLRVAAAKGFGGGSGQKLPKQSKKSKHGKVASRPSPKRTPEELQRRQRAGSTSAAAGASGDDADDSDYELRLGGGRPANAHADLESNVAAAHLGLEQWEEAYLAARRSLDLDPASTKARYCLARAMLHLRCYGPALEHLQAVAQQEPGFKAATELLRVAQVLAEQAQGRFKMAALLEGQAAGSSKAPPVADWVGPLETFDSPTAGRGLRATRAVPEGQLLLVERALAVAQAPQGSFSLNFDAEGRINACGSQQQLAGTLLQVASASALDRQRVMSLYSGAGAALADEAVAVPAALQPFGTEEALQAALEAARAAAATGAGPDLLRTEAAVKYNAWEFDGGQHDDALPPSAAASGEHCGVWALLSAANHSCAPNAHVVVVDCGSLTLLRASRPIAAGEEVTVAYNDEMVWQPLRRRRSLLANWGFRCCCARCVAEDGLPPSLHQEIEAIADNVGDFHTPGPWRRRFREAKARRGKGAPELGDEILGRLWRLEASLNAAVGLPADFAFAAGRTADGGTEEQQQHRQLVFYGLACVLGAFRFAILCAQMGEDITPVLLLHKACLRIMEAVRPGDIQHVSVAATYAVDAARATPNSAPVGRHVMPAAKEAFVQALLAAKTRYGREAREELSDMEAANLLDRLLLQQA